MSRPWPGTPNGKPSPILTCWRSPESERRAVVTNNIRDFRPLHVEAVLPGGAGHYGMIFMPGTYRRSKNDIGRIVAALEAKLGQYPGEDDLANAEEWL